MLSLVEGDLPLALAEFSRGGILVKETVNKLTLEDGSLHDLLDVLFLDFYVENSIGLDGHEGSHLAKALTAAVGKVNTLTVSLFSQFYGHRDSAALQNLLESFVNLHGAVGEASGSGADDDPPGVGACEFLIVSGDFFSVKELHGFPPS